MSGDDTIEVYCEVLATRPDSIKVNAEGTECFLPRSMIRASDSDIDPYDCREGDRGNVSIPVWIAEDRGLV